MKKLSELLSDEQLDRFVEDIDVAMEAHDPGSFDTETNTWTCECGYRGDLDGSDRHEARVLIEAICEKVIPLYEQHKDELTESVQEWQDRLNRDIDALGPLKPGI